MTTQERRTDMPTETTPYITRNPGDLITAEDWNDVQKKIKENIAKQIQDAIQKVDNVPNAANAHKLENQTPEELTNDILEKVRQELPTRTGYRKLFKRLKKGEEKVIKHQLEACPLVDVYQLDYFKVICSEDDEKSAGWVNFYLYHTSEKRIRFTDPNVTSKTTINVDIEPKEGTPYRIPFKDMLALYKVSYTETTSLGDLETEFWKAFFAEPNDSFDDDQYCHSPWFDRCCGEKRTVGDLKQKGDWNDLWFKMQPRKTINYSLTATNPTPAPTQIQVVHFDFDNLGIKLVTDPVLPTPEGEEGPVSPPDELKVMMLLKV
jgi:hypothetical protein